MARSGLFEKQVLGRILRGMGGLPVYRRQDDPSQTHRNQGTFDAAVEALRAGDAVQIFPEGISHSDPFLAPIRTGAARIAFQAEADSDWDLGLRILPVGLVYSRKTVFRGQVVANVGRPLQVSEWKERWLEDDREAVTGFTDTIRHALGELTLNLSSEEERELVEVADRIWAREHGLASWREREALGTRLPRLQEFGRAAAWLRARDPDAYYRLADRVRAYARMTGVLGTAEADVPPRYGRRAALRYALREGIPLLLGLPVAVLGTLIWFPVYFGSRVIVGRIRPYYEALSTYKLSAAAALAPLDMAAWGLGVGWWFGWRWGLAMVLAMIPVGLLTIWWRERWTRVTEDVRLFLRLARRRDRLDRLARMRGELVAEMDRVVAEFRAPASDPSAGAGRP
jgi:1-acyl-sn-glycerol-3-phosphate acyltransferase